MPHYELPGDKPRPGAIIYAVIGGILCFFLIYSEMQCYQNYNTKMNQSDDYSDFEKLPGVQKNPNRR
jgi:hypothetical protein